MALSNPIILKELLQAAHRRRTYILRTVLPVIAILFLWPQISMSLSNFGQDWRAIQRIGRGVFFTLAWVELIAFSILAFVYAQSTIRDEWRRKTIEVLCASPLSNAGIVYGKFVGVLSKVMLGVLALAPVLGITLHLARMERDMALGILAVVSGSVLFFGTAALTQAALFRPSKLYAAAGAVTVLLPYYVIVIYLDVFVWKGHPYLNAAISPVALGVVLYGGMPGGGMSAGTFALWSLGIHVGLSAVFLGLTPWLFSRTFARHIGSSRPPGIWLRLKRVTRGRRKAMKPAEDPFTWQEKGPPARLLRCGLWVVYGITAIFTVGYAYEFNRGRFDFVDDEGFLMSMAIIGIVTLVLQTCLYGASVFSREKARRTAQALLLTGASPARFFWSKVKAVYRALRYSLAAVFIVSVFALAAIGVELDDIDEVTGSALMMEALFLGPLVGAIIGMTFSVHAKTPSNAVLAFFGSGVWMIILGWLTSIFALFLWDSSPGGFLIIGLVATGALLAASWRRWSPWRLGCLLACSAYVFGTGLATIVDSLDYLFEFPGVFLAGNLIAWALVGLWLRIGLGTFNVGLAGEGTSSKRSRV